MFYGWGKFKGWKVLEFFLENNEKIHVNGLAKKLKISPSTAQLYLTEYEKQWVLEKEKTANIVAYSLKDSALSRELKKAVFISKINSFVADFFGENQDIAKIALFGSHAKGTYDKKSDIDLLVISQNKKLELNALKKLEKKLAKEPKIQVFTLAEWKSLLKKKDSFAMAVLRNNISLFGEPL